jgi:hypothetical protein
LATEAGGHNNKGQQGDGSSSGRGGQSDSSDSSDSDDSEDWAAMRQRVKAQGRTGEVSCVGARRACLGHLGVQPRTSTNTHRRMNIQMCTHTHMRSRCLLTHTHTHTHSASTNVGCVQAYTHSRTHLFMHTRTHLPRLFSMLALPHVTPALQAAAHNSQRSRKLLVIRHSSPTTLPTNIARAARHSTSPAVAPCKALRMLVVVGTAEAGQASRVPVASQVLAQAVA